jgi:cysteine-rich repeat protein
MTFRGVVVIVACALVSGCTQSKSVQCGDLFCSEISVCSPAGNACVLPSQLDACKGKADDDACTFPGVTMGACVAGVCTEVVCGNEHVDTITGEVCDDGNRLSGDGCSADCKSREMCGDGVVDVFKSEECDCGIDESVPLPAGCTSTNNDVGGVACRLDCKRARCGDGIMDPGELCDDGNNTPGDGCRADCQGRWTQLATSTFVALNAVWAVSETEAYAVGSSGRFLRWNGSNWVILPGPNTTANLTDVWAHNASAVWVVEKGSSAVWHYSGSAWTEIIPGANDEHWTAISGTGPNDIWLSGYRVTSVDEGRFAHFNGNWAVFGGTSNTKMHFTDIYAAPGGPVYATEFYNDDVYTLSVGTPNVTGPLGGIIRGSRVAGTAPNHVVVYSGGSPGVKGGKFYNGSTWTLMANSDEIPLVNAVAAATGPMGTQQIAVGAAGNVMVCNGATCVGWPAPTSSVLTGVATYGYDRAFIVGENGVIFY